MQGNESKDVWVLRGDLESKHQGLKSKIPHNPLNIKLIPDNGAMIKDWTFGGGIDWKSEKKLEWRDWRLKQVKNSVTGCKINHSH